MIQGGNLLLEIQIPDKLIFNMIKGRAGVGGVNDLVHCSEGDLSTCSVPYMCAVKEAFSILAPLISLER